VEHHCEEGSSTDSSSTLKPPSLPPKLGLHWLDNGAELTGLKMEQLVRGGHGMLLGSRIPKHYFMVKGFGETDQGDGSDPWETGSYDLALEDAGIQDLNVIKYTSVIPPEAEAVSVEEAKPFLRHGAVLESIMSVMHGVKGDRITAGVGRVQIRRKRDKFHIGGYAAEYEGHASADKAKSILKKDLVGIFQRRFDDKEYECFEEDFIIQESEVDKSFGSVLASICFVTYVLPAYTRA
jgi:arginine decarboxylase